MHHLTSITKLFFCGGYPRIFSENVGRLSLNLYNYFRNVGRLTWCMFSVHVQFMVKFSPNHSFTPQFTLGLHILSCCWSINPYIIKALLKFQPLHITFLHHNPCVNLVWTSRARAGIFQGFNVVNKHEIECLYVYKHDIEWLWTS